MAETGSQQAAKESGKRRRGMRGPRAIGATVSRLARSVLGKRGFAEAAIVTDWNTVVGPHLAAYTLPTRIAHVRGSRDEGTLHLRVAGGAFATEVLHLESMIVERINTYFGYRAVARLKIVQGPLPKRPAPPKPRLRSLDEAGEQALAADVAGVETDDLREALARLGRAVMAKEE